MPLPAAETFTFCDEAGSSLSDVAGADTMGIVVETLGLDDFISVQARGEEERCTVSDVLVDQVMCADAIVLDTIDPITGAERERLEYASRQFNRHAEIRGEHTHETEEYGVGSFVYRARRAAAQGARQGAIGG
jgi:G3E family GTPase